MSFDLNKLTQSEVAQLFGRNVRTIQRWGEEGLPRHGESRATTYVWAEILPWYVAYMSGNQGEGVGDKERKLKAEADMAEMEAREMAGRLLDRDKSRGAWAAFLGALKDNWLGLADRSAPNIQDGMTLAERRDVIHREVTASMRRVVDEAQRLEGAGE